MAKSQDKLRSGACNGNFVAAFLPYMVQECCIFDANDLNERFCSDFFIRQFLINNSPIDSRSQ